MGQERVLRVGDVGVVRGRIAEVGYVEDGVLDLGARAHLLQGDDEAGARIGDADVVPRAELLDQRFRGPAYHRVARAALDRFQHEHHRDGRLLLGIAHLHVDRKRRLEWRPAEAAWSERVDAAKHRQAHAEVLCRGPQGLHLLGVELLSRDVDQRHRLVSANAGGRARHGSGLDHGGLDAGGVQRCGDIGPLARAALGDEHPLRPQHLHQGIGGVVLLERVQRGGDAHADVVHAWGGRGKVGVDLSVPWCECLLTRDHNCPVVADRHPCRGRDVAADDGTNDEPGPGGHRGGPAQGCHEYLRAGGNLDGEDVDADAGLMEQGHLGEGVAGVLAAVAEDDDVLARVAGEERRSEAERPLDVCRVAIGLRGEPAEGAVRCGHRRLFDDRIPAEGHDAETVVGAQPGAELLHGRRLAGERSLHAGTPVHDHDERLRRGWKLQGEAGERERDADEDRAAQRQRRPGAEPRERRREAAPHEHRGWHGKEAEQSQGGRELSAHDGTPATRR